MQKLTRSTSIGIKEKHLVADATAHLGYRVTPADVSAKTGLSLFVTDTILKQLAAETGGCVEVDETGKIVYRLPPGFRNIFLGRRLKAAFKPVLVPALKLFAYLFRCLMAVMLMLSPVMILSIYSLALSREGRIRDRELQNLFAPFLSLFAWHYDPNDLERLPSFLQNPPEINSSYAYDIVTFLLGNRDSYREEQERQWKYIATLIRTNSGVVTSEQLAPYTGSDGQDEAAVASILARFDGYPEVTPLGNIVYVFPSLQVSTNENITDELPKTFIEKRLRFGSARGQRARFLWSFALVNLLFYIPVAKAMHWFSETTPYALFGYLYVAFGIVFALAPTLRWLMTAINNILIEKRNRKRRHNLALLENPSPNLVSKLEEARRFSQQLDFIDGSKLEYHTSSDLIEQKFARVTPDYLEHDNGRVVTIEPEQANTIKKLTELLDPDSIVLINPPAGQDGMALIGQYEKRPVFVRIEQMKWDYDIVEIAIGCETLLELEIARPIPKNFVSKSSLTNVVITDLRMLWPALSAYSLTDNPTPEWLKEDDRFQFLITKLFRKHNIERLVLKEGIRIIQKTSGLVKESSLFELLLNLAERLEELGFDASN
ncbi:MAG: hypothetical protein K8F91_07410, partial [Candidatus Obscuribacterales bacterium]|nr:hypothetical protein [Candidatus Obscuribacterales bacterium]